MFEPVPAAKSVFTSGVYPGGFAACGYFTAFAAIQVTYRRELPIHAVGFLGGLPFDLPGPIFKKGR